LVKNGFTVTKKILCNIVTFIPWIVCPKCSRLLVYLSWGGTCRDPMAKIITEQILKKKPLLFKVKIKAMALGALTSTSVSYAARNAIKEMYGKDLLINHKPQMVTQEALDKADLILVMDRSLMDNKTLKNRSDIYLFKEFFGSSGDVVDPYPDGKNQERLSEYRKCAEEMRTLIELKIDLLISALKSK